MLCIRSLISLTICYVAFARPAGRTTIEVLSKDSNSMMARFRPARGVKHYFASVYVQDLMDVVADYTVKLTRADRQPDGYYYINATGNLQSGHTYEIWLADGKTYDTRALGEFFTDCDRYSYQCHTSYGETCVSPQELCDGHERCLNGEDEDRDDDGNCAVKLPARPTAQHPPPTAPCVVQKNEAIATGRYRYLSCDQDGSYSAMYCTDDYGSFDCYCIDKSTGEKLYVQKRFQPFVHWNFSEKCERDRGARMSQHTSP